VESKGPFAIERRWPMSVWFSRLKFLEGTALLRTRNIALQLLLILLDLYAEPRSRVPWKLDITASISGSSCGTAAAPGSA
jgi:hypothetical protein